MDENVLKCQKSEDTQFKFTHFLAKWIENLLF